MNVLIPNLDLPKSCFECPMYNDLEGYCVLYSNGIPSRYNYNRYGRSEVRPPWCELINVPLGEWKLKTFDDGYGEYQLYECSCCGNTTARRRKFCAECGVAMKEMNEEAFDKHERN